MLNMESEDWIDLYITCHMVKMNLENKIRVLYSFIIYLLTQQIFTEGLLCSKTFSMLQGHRLKNM